MITSPNNQEYGNSLFVVRWTLLLLGGLLLSFLGRTFAYQDGPCYVASPFPLFVGVASVVLFIIGGSLFERGLTQRNALRKRNAAMVIILGAFLLVGNFAFSRVVPLIFG